MNVTAIVLAAGRSSRFKSRIPKPLAEINAKPVIIYCLSVLSKHPAIKNIIVVVNRKNSRQVFRKIKQYRIAKVSSLVMGGLRRQDSVASGLGAINKDADLVLIHDAARPFLDSKIISAVIKQARKNSAAIVGVPVKATIKETNRGSCLSGRQASFVKKTLDRSKLWEIQTPQVFKKKLILEAYRRFKDIDVTDDAMLVEKSGARVSVVCGSYNNIKITTPEDLIIAEAILKAKNI